MTSARRLGIPRVPVWLMGWLLLACDGTALGVPDASTDAAASADAGVGPAGFVFEPDALGSDDAFFDLPYPSDLRTDDDGRPDLRGFPRARGIIADAIDLLADEGPGFSPLTGVYFRLDGPLDEGSLPADPGDVQADDAVVQLLDVDPESPDRGRRLPAYVRFQRAPTRFWPAHTLVVRPVPGLHLHPGRRYAVVVGDGLVAADGTPVAPAEAFEALKAGGGDGALAVHYAALFEELESLGVPRATVRAATTFTVADPAREMDVARAYVASRPLPEVRGWAAVAERPAERRFEAVFDTYEVMDGEPPFMTFGSGRIAFDDAGAPRVERRAPVRVGLTVPSGEPPAGGWPVVLYGHGTGGDERTHFGDEGSALASVGIASLGFEAALHGDRNPDGFDVSTLVVANPIAARETVRQTVIDQMLVLRMLADARFDVPVTVAGGSEIWLDPERALYMGHSQGSQEGGLLLAVEPTLEAAFLSAGGAGGVISILEREITTGQPLSCLVAGVVGEACEVLTEDHPVLTLLIQPLLDPADPASFAHRYLRERPADWAPLSVAMTEGTEDVYTPPRTIEALAAAAGLPLVEPVVQTTDPLRLLGAPSVAPPVAGNLTVPGGAAVTGGLMQWAGEGHFAIYRNDDARRRYVEFFRTAVADGTPTIVAP